VFGGTDIRNDEYFACYDLMVAGWGGRSFADGNSATNVINGNNRMTPAEVFETRYPWRVESYALVRDSGGAGKFRGGLGTTKTLLCVNPQITVSFFGDRQKRPPWGVHGGQGGGTGKIELQRPGGDFVPMHSAFGKRSPSKFAAVTVRKGERVRITTPGSGGWGPTNERDSDSIREDIAEGLVSAEQAEKDYGRLSKAEQPK
jgi:N-methylhydantoinase B/oxoprolinase/acetone carboxylase alpha subunit